jgi:hypothetical protein
MADVIVFKLGRHQVTLDRREATEIRDRVSERTFAGKWLYAGLTGALDAETERVEVIVKDEEVRQEILRDLAAIKQENPLTEGQRRLWDVAQFPIQNPLTEGQRRLWNVAQFPILP